MTLAPEEIHVLGISAPILLRMFRAKEDSVINKIYGEFRTGKTEQLTALAEFAALRSIINDITNALKQHEAAEEKKHANANRTTADRP